MARGRDRIDRLGWGERRGKYERKDIGRGEKICRVTCTSLVGEEPSGLWSAKSGDLRTSRLIRGQFGGSHSAGGGSHVVHLGQDRVTFFGPGQPHTIEPVPVQNEH